MKILVTGAAGFIGMHTSLELLKLGFEVVGIDNMNSYYDLNLKLERLKIISSNSINFKFYKIDLSNKVKIDKLFHDFNFNIVINLAAQAGVRYSLKNPHRYLDSNVLGFLNILEACRNKSVSHLIYASSSSVYGLNSKTPFNENDTTDHPISLYGATKKANEMMAHSYSHLYKIPTTGLRFFTVYGPWGRPDMAPMIFAKAILEGTPISLYNYGDMDRDFTFISDIVDAIVSIIHKPPNINKEFNNFKPETSLSSGPFKIFNIGQGNPINILTFVEILEKELKRKAIIKTLPMQLGDVKSTYSDTRKLTRYSGFSPKIKVQKGISKFIKWFLKYNKK